MDIKYNIATNTTFGVVKGATETNKISVDEKGELISNDITTDKIVQIEDIILILDASGGKS